MYELKHHKSKYTNYILTQVNSELSKWLAANMSLVETWRAKFRSAKPEFERQEELVSQFFWIISESSISSIKSAKSETLLPNSVHSLLKKPEKPEAEKNWGGHRRLLFACHFIGSATSIWHYHKHIVDIVVWDTVIIRWRFDRYTVFIANLPQPKYIPIYNK